MRTCEHICIVIIRSRLMFPRLIPPAHTARSYEYFRCYDFHSATSDSDRDFRFQRSRFPVQADVTRFRFRFPIPIQDFKILRFRYFSRIRDFANPRFRDSAISRFRGFAIPRFRDSGISRFRDSAISRFRDFAILPCIRNSVTSELSREYPRCSIFEAHRQRSVVFATSAPR